MSEHEVLMFRSENQEIVELKRQNANLYTENAKLREQVVTLIKIFKEDQMARTMIHGPTCDCMECCERRSILKRIEENR